MPTSTSSKWFWDIESAASSCADYGSCKTINYLTKSFENQNIQNFFDSEIESKTFEKVMPSLEDNAALIELIGRNSEKDQSLYASSKFLRRLVKTILRNCFEPPQISQSQKCLYENAELVASWKRYGWPGKSFKSHSPHLQHVNVQYRSNVDMILKSNQMNKNIMNMNVNPCVNSDLQDVNIKIDQEQLDYTPTSLGMRCVQENFENLKGHKKDSPFPHNNLAIKKIETEIYEKLASFDADKKSEQLLQKSAINLAFAQCMAAANQENDFWYHEYGKLDYTSDIKNPITSISVALNNELAVFCVFQLNTFRLDLRADQNPVLNLYSTKKCKILAESGTGYSDDFLKYLLQALLAPKQNSVLNQSTFPIKAKPTDLKLDKSERIYYYLNM